jgi:erythromycin esterase
MRSNYLVLLAFMFPSLAHGQSAPVEPFQQWARQHVHPISSVDQDTPDNADLRALNSIVGDARVLAFGEPFHFGHEPLAMRNRMIRYAVTKLGFTAVALETALSPSKRLYDHVLGKTTETESALKEAFSYGFGKLPEDLELIGWLRSFNQAQPPARKVRLYGIDLTGQYAPYAFRSIETVLTFMDHADPGLGRELRKQYAGVISVFRSDKYVKLTPAEKDAITGKVQDMVALLRRERIPLTAATSADEYEWVLRQALNAAQDDAFLRATPSEFDFMTMVKSPEQYVGERWEHNEEMRELAMADNLRWVEQRESSRGKVFFFAHDAHVQANIQVFVRPITGRTRPAGMYLRSALGGDMVVIGTHFGRGAGFPAESAPEPPDTAGMDSLLNSLSLPCFMMDLRELPSAGILHEWFQADHETRAGRGVTTRVAALGAYDAILFIGTITPTPAPPH